MYEYKTKLIRVVDGDTIVCAVSLGFYMYHEATLRLEGINAPELRSKDPAIRAAARISRDYLEARLRQDGEKLVIHTFKDKTEKFGRMLARIFIDGVNVNQEMIEKGLGVPFMPEIG